jgi:hypothetical protein
MILAARLTADILHANVRALVASKTRLRSRTRTFIEIEAHSLPARGSRGSSEASSEFLGKRWLTCRGRRLPFLAFTCLVLPHRCWLTTCLGWSTAKDIFHRSSPLQVINLLLQGAQKLVGIVGLRGRLLRPDRALPGHKSHLDVKILEDRRKKIVQGTRSRTSPLNSSASPFVKKPPDKLVGFQDLFKAWL